MSKRVGILTGGGDCPGLNAVIRAAVVKGTRYYNFKFIGLKNGWAGLLDFEWEHLDREKVSGILHRGGTILGTSRTNPCKSKEIKELAHSLGAVPNIQPGIIPMKDGSPDPQRYDITFEEWAEYVVGNAGLSYIPDWEGELAGKLMCNAGRLTCSITPFGDVNPCVLLPVKLGNLREERFERIWRGREREKLLEHLNPSKMVVCSDCELLPFCSRCSGVAYMETGDLTGPSPSACKYAGWRAKIALNTVKKGGE